MMKTTFLLTITFLISTNATLFAQNDQQTDSCEYIYYQYLDTLPHETRFYEGQVIIKEEYSSTDSISKPGFKYVATNETRFNGISWWAYGVPPILLFVIIGAIAWITISSKFNLGEALSEIKIVDSKSVLIPSSSRLIAFFSAIVALILSGTIILVSLYVFLLTGVLPVFDTLINALLALGIGIVPYSINKITGAFKTNNT